MYFISMFFLFCLQIIHTNSGLCVQSEKDVFAKRAMLILQHCGVSGKEKKYQVLLESCFFLDKQYLNFRNPKDELIQSKEKYVLNITICITCCIILRPLYIVSPQGPLAQGWYRSRVDITCGTIFDMLCSLYHIFYLYFKWV